MVVVVKKKNQQQSFDIVLMPCADCSIPKIRWNEKKDDVKLEKKMEKGIIFNINLFRDKINAIALVLFLILLSHTICVPR